MSEILLSKIPISIPDPDETLSEILFPLPASGTLKERYAIKWEREDEAVHPARRVWRRRYRNVLGEFMRRRGVR
jgi:hypothetical protein